MQVICDIEADSLENPSQIWLVVCRDIETGQHHIFREVTRNVHEKKRFLDFAQGVDLWVGHHFVGYDYPHLHRLVGLDLSVGDRIRDTLIVTRLVEYAARKKHSIEAFGEEFGFPKIDFSDFSKYSPDMEEYCIRDVDICFRIYQKYKKQIHDPAWQPAMKMEHEFQLIVNALHDNGFQLNTKQARKLLEKVTKELSVVDGKIAEAFPPRLQPIKEVTPVTTAKGTLNKKDFRFVKDGDLSEYNGGPFTRCEWTAFNAASPKQVVTLLNAAGWKPKVKTKTHIDAERDLNRLKYVKNRSSSFDLEYSQVYNKLNTLKIYGWRICEANLDTLPETAPTPARLLAKRIMLESRRKTLTEWLDLADPTTGRLHGRYLGIGAWTQRMAHQEPNTANIPREDKFLGKEMRSLWQAAKNRLLVGVDADAIQFRIAAHYINDPELIRKIVEGKKSDGTDPHSYNKKLIGDFCKSRDASKRTLFSLILGGGPPKLAEILESTREQAELGRDKLYQEYPGLVRLKEEIVVEDAQRGWFYGLDGRKVIIPGSTFSERKHLCPSGYLQNGEAVIMKHACVLWHSMLQDDPELKDFIWHIVNFVHDEWQTEVGNDMRLALRVAQTQSDSLRIVGERLGCRCPMAGSYYNDGKQDYTIGTDWYQTH